MVLVLAMSYLTKNYDTKEERAKIQGTTSLPYNRWLSLKNFEKGNDRSDLHTATITQDVVCMKIE